MILFAVHIPDAVLTAPWLYVGWLLLVAMCWLALKCLDQTDIPRIGLLTSSLFVASQLHIPIGIGSAHLLLNTLAGVILGTRAPLAIAIAIAMQALFFAHGGLTTIGINATVMSLPALLAVLLFPRMMKKWPDQAYLIGASLGVSMTLLTVLLNALTLWLGGNENTQKVVPVLLLIHVPVIAIEGLATGTLFAYFAKVKPEWLATELLSPEVSPRQTEPPTDPDPDSQALSAS